MRVVTNAQATESRRVAAAERIECERPLLERIKAHGWPVWLALPKIHAIPASEATDEERGCGCGRA